MRFLFLILLGNVISAQNLVQNHSFEIHTSCPGISGQISLANFWSLVTNTSGTPDYFNTCATWAGVQIPNNNMGNQQAYEGTAYAGIHTYAIGPDVSENFREYFQTQLSVPLITGQNYLISFYVSRAENFRFASNNIGALLTNQPIIGNNTFLSLNINPTIWNQNIITDSNGWTLISGSYQALGNEQYLTIGNFSNNASTQISIENPNTTSDYYTAYYYIDNVSVVHDQLNNDEFKKQDIVITPNPTSDYFTINSLEIYSITNIDLFSQYNKVRVFDIRERTFDIKYLSPGIYYLIITFESSKKVVTKIIKT